VPLLHRHDGYHGNGRHRRGEEEADEARREGEVGGEEGRRVEGGGEGVLEVLRVGGGDERLDEPVVVRLCRLGESSHVISARFTCDLGEFCIWF